MACWLKCRLTSPRVHSIFQGTLSPASRIEKKIVLVSFRENVSHYSVGPEESLNSSLICAIGISLLFQLNPTQVRYVTGSLTT